MVSGTELRKSITNENYYNWSQHKTHKGGSQNGDKAKQVM